MELTKQQKINEAKSVYEVYTNQVKVFQMNDNDWVAAKTLEEAVEWYKNNITDEEEYIPEVHEIEDLDNFMITFTSETESDIYEDIKNKYWINKSKNTFEVPVSEVIKVEWNGAPYLFSSAMW